MLENYPIRMHDEAVGTKSISPETSGSIHFLLARGLSPSPIDFDCPPISKLVLTRSLDRLLVQSISLESITPLSYALGFNVIDFSFLEERTLIFFN